MNQWISGWRQAGSAAWPHWLRRARRSQRPSSEFLTLFQQLREAQSAVAQASGELEAQFLSTGSELEALARSGEQFVKQVEKLIGLVTGRGCDESVFAGAIRLIERSTQFLVECQEQTLRMLESLRDYNAQIEQLLGVETELHRTMLPLKFVQTLFKAESAPLGAGVQQMFVALTQEIESLHGQVREVFGTKFKQLEQTHATIGQVVSQLETQTRSLAQVTTTHRVRIQSSLATLTGEMGANQQRDLRLGSLSKQLAREVEQVVMGLQFQDIVNQKLQHVAGALPEIEAKFAEFTAASGLPRAGGPMQYLHQSCRLEAGQLQVAEAELAQAEETIRSGVQRVLSHLTEVDSQCLSLAEFKLLTTSFDGIVQVLLETLEEVRRLVTASVTRAAEAYELLRPLGSLASDLTAIVREMSGRIHLLGLNAQVQAALAARDRRGAGLEVLSTRTSEISGETSRISEQAARQLDAVASGLVESVRAFERLRTQGLSQQTLLEREGRTEEQRLHVFRDDALETLREIGTLLDQIRAQAEQALANIRFTRFHQVTLPALRLPLAAIAEKAEQWLRVRGFSAAEANLVGGLKRGYTMASERKVFDEVVSPGAAAGLDRQSGTPGPAPEMELFTEVPVTPEIPELVALSPQRSSEVPAEVAVVSAGADLGANVELF